MARYVTYVADFSRASALCLSKEGYEPKHVEAGAEFTMLINFQNIHFPLLCSVQ